MNFKFKPVKLWVGPGDILDIFDAFELSKSLSAAAALKTQSFGQTPAERESIPQYCLGWAMVGTRIKEGNSIL